ncbi:MAG: lysoplasmalogenase [Anaerolineae bacterium]
MKTALNVLPVLAITVFFLIRAEFRKAQRQIYVLKPLATLLVIAAALLSFGEARLNLTYTLGALVGLALSFGGDIALMFQTNRKAFMIGLVLFLLAHVAYAVTFTRLGGLQAIVWLAAPVLAALGLGIYRLFRGGLGAMKGPVIVYIVVISVMVNQAVATFNSSTFSVVQAWMIAIGAVLFYISDVILAANRFWKPFQYNRISLAFYYAGQFLIALAASYFV